MTLGKLPWIDNRDMFCACSFAQKLMAGNEKYPPKAIDEACTMAARKYNVEPVKVKEIVQQTVPGIHPETAAETHEVGAERISLSSLDRKLDQIIEMLRKGQEVPF